MRHANPGLNHSSDDEVEDEALWYCEELNSKGVDGFLSALISVSAARGDVSTGVVGALVPAVTWKCPEFKDDLREWVEARN